MHVGAQVVCINDTFEPLIRKLYYELPVKNATYTVREVSLGRETIVSKGDSVTVRILLKELVNLPDPLHVGSEELGFNAERFREVEEVAESEELVETIHKGYEADNGDSWKNS